MMLLCAFLLGLVSGLRSMLAPAAVSWAARLGMLGVADTPLAFMGYQYTPIIFSALAVGELIVDKLPRTPSRKSPPGFIARIISGALGGATIGFASRSLVPGVVAGVAGAVVGTLGGSAARAKLAALFGKDLPAALIEDAAGIVIIALCLLALN